MVVEGVHMVFRCARTPHMREFCTQPHTDTHEILVEVGIETFQIVKVHFFP